MSKLQNIYTQLVYESNRIDHREYEKDINRIAGSPAREPGLHVQLVEDILTTDGKLIPANVNFDAEWENADYEPTDTGNYKLQNAGFSITPFNFTIPSDIPQEDLDPSGHYKPGQDITEFISSDGYIKVVEYLERLFNQD